MIITLPSSDLLNMLEIRNIAIIAHVDCGKATSVDKIIDECKVLDERKASTELLFDSIDLVLKQTL